VATDSLLQLKIADFLDRLASKEPLPGGGSVAALTGALAAGLGQMVAAYTLGKPKFAAVEPQVQTAAERLARARTMLSKLVDEDAAAYGVLNEALKLDKADVQRGPRVAGAARLAASVPLETVALVRAALVSLRELETIGNPLLRSDAAAAIALAEAAILAAAANVRANLSLMSPPDAEHMRSSLEALLTKST
jgi:methenyltetrahydrofolate cyclohydrolase